jgi:hypothetical protein
MVTEHTECLGHITRIYSINQAETVFFMAELVSVPLEEEKI